MPKNDRFASNPSFNEGLRYELGDGVSLNLKKALKFYQKAANQGHYLSQLKVKQTQLRWFPSLILTLLSIVNLLYFITIGFLWIGLLISLFFSITVS